MTNGLFIINTGNGKGKTTAAFGNILRALGHNMKCSVAQFIKQRPTGEITALKKMFPELVSIVQCGKGFTWESDDISKDIQAAKEGWSLAKEIIQKGEVSIVLLDEITYPINYNMIDIDDVVNTIKQRPRGMTVITTGRDAPTKLIQLADCVSEISPVKHHFDNNIPMQRGIEF